MAVRSCVQASVTSSFHFIGIGIRSKWKAIDWNWRKLVIPVMSIDYLVDITKLIIFQLEFFNKRYAILSIFQFHEVYHLEFVTLFYISFVFFRLIQWVICYLLFCVVRRLHIWEVIYDWTKLVTDLGTIFKFINKNKECWNIIARFEVNEMRSIIIKRTANIPIAGPLCKYFYFTLYFLTMNHWQQSNFKLKPKNERKLLK